MGAPTRWTILIYHEPPTISYDGLRPTSPAGSPALLLEGAHRHCVTLPRWQESWKWSGVQFVPWKMGILPVLYKELWRRRKRMILTFVECLRHLAMLSGAAGCLTWGNHPHLMHKQSEVWQHAGYQLSGGWYCIIRHDADHCFWQSALVVSPSLTDSSFRFWLTQSGCSQIRLKMGMQVPQIPTILGHFEQIPQNNHKQYKLQTNSLKQIKVWSLRTISYLWEGGGQISVDLWPERYAKGRGGLGWC